MNLYKDNITFDDYKQLVEKYSTLKEVNGNNDTREVNYQNEIVKPMLQIIFKDWEVVDVSRKGPDSDVHKYFEYSGKYKVKMRDKPATPDLLLVEKWNWHNIENKLTYYAAIEVKSPYSNDHMCNREYKEYSSHLKAELKRHLQANKVVIATDTYKWGIYSQEQGLKPVKEYEIRAYKSRKWVWNESEYNRLVEDLEKLRDNNMDLSVI